MNLDSLIRTYLSRPTYQRLFMAGTVGLVLSCAARVSEAPPAADATATQPAAAAVLIAHPAGAR
jgi:hypothetical protein